MLIRLTPNAPVASMVDMMTFKTPGKLTAHTVTDAQIRGLARTALTASQHKDCELAVSARREMLTTIAGKLAMHYPTTKERRAARARCAALIASRLCDKCDQINDRHAESNYCTSCRDGYSKRLAALGHEYRPIGAK